MSLLGKKKEKCPPLPLTNSIPSLFETPRWFYRQRKKANSFFVSGDLPYRDPTEQLGAVLRRRNRGKIGQKPLLAKAEKGEEPPR